VRYVIAISKLFASYKVNAESMEKLGISDKLR
jgi:hypothetical protein